MTSPARWRRLLGRLVGRAKPDESPRGPFARAARFDPSWYLLTYPDARQAVDAGRCADALTHYRTLGAAAAYDPNPRFSEVGYRRSYPEVIAAIEAGHSPSGFEHFAGLGRFEGRPPNDWPFDSDFYLAHYPDAAQAIAAERFTSALEHYWEVGAGEGRDPHAVFSEVAYRQRYPDVAAGIAEGRYLCAYQHFLCYGAEEGRQPHPLFDEAHYRHLHPDIDDGIRDGTIADAYFHLATLGLAEGRRWKTADEDARLRQAATRLARCRLDELLASERRIDLTPPDEPAVSVLVVLFGRAELSLACFESLTRLRDPSFELIVVDNASTDRTPRLLDRLQGARILRNDDNFGFTRAANQAAAEARGEMLLFLNNDAELLPSSLVAAVNRLRAESEAGAVGGRVLGLDGKLQEAGSIVWRDGTTGGYGRGDEPTHGAYLFPRPVDYCSGVFLLTRRRTFEALGGFDAAFEPAYYEESDYCFRLRAAGHTVFYEPRSLVLHHGAASLPDATHLSRMLADHRQIFAERHAEALAEAYPATTANLFPASDRRRFRGRVLVLDDHVPLEALGGGSPRQQEILHTLCELGFFVTFFATNPTRLDLEAALAELPAPNLELIHDLGRPKFPDFWQERREAYDILIVSRQHNFRCLLEDGFDPSQERVRLIYDAESVAARRRQAQLELLGPDVPQESEVDVDDELRLAHRAPEIWAVSVAEAELLGSPDHTTAVIAHGECAEPSERPFAERRGILFVGRLDEAWNPNVDGLRWYLEEIHPRIVDRLGDVPTTVVGQPGDVDLPRPEGIRFLGRVDDLAPLYDRHRLFIAPTRFAAGIAKKITGAAAHGLPVVATHLLAEQLEWRGGKELADGGNNAPQRFADRVVELYRHEDLWQRLRKNALERVRREHGREALRRSIEQALDLESRPTRS